jgi:small subunit ribosomal protein S1
LTGTEECRPTEENSAQAPPTNPPANTTKLNEPTAETPAAGEISAAESEAAGAPARRILIGSQRDPVAYRARTKRDWTPVEGEGEPGDKGPSEGEHRRRHRGGRGRRERQGAGSGEQRAGSAEHVAGGVSAPRIVERGTSGMPVVPAAPPPAAPMPASAPAAAMAPPPVAAPRVALPPIEPLPEVVMHPVTDDTPVIPGKRQKLSASMEAELDRAMAGVSFDELMSGTQGGPVEGVLEPESRHRVRVAALHRDDVFVEFGGRAQGCIPVRSFETPPQVGDEIEVIVQRYHAEEGLYDLSLPGAAVDLGNWDEVREGMLVDAQVTGHNTGGLECEVNHIRGFIPVSQISLYRVEDVAQFVGQRLTCLITEANPERRNLVLSRRAVLEREKEEKKEQFFASLAPGQIHEGTVRKLMDFGAFVELGNGIDGLLHVSQLSWGRVKHPSEVVQEGQPVRVRIEKIDPQTGRIGLSYRDLLENPWTAAAAKFPPRSQARGKVTRLMDFGAFVELEPGIEGLVHISELSNKRVWRPADVVKEGDEIEVLVLSVDPQAQRMSLSVRALHQPEPTKKEKEEQEPQMPAATKKSSRPSNLPLKGGLGRTGGEQFGLKW